MTPLAAITPARLSALSRCAAVFLPSDPPRAGRVAFWRPDGAPVEEAGGADGATDGDGGASDGDGGTPDGEAWAAERLEVVLPDEDEDGGVSLCEVPALVLTVAEAVPVLTRARAARSTHPAAAFWGAAAVLALQLAARGRLLPGVSPDGHDAWRLGPLDPVDIERLRDLAAAMPPYAHAVPLPDSAPPALPDPERQVRAFLDAVADGLPRSPAAALVTGAPAFAVPAPQQIPEQRAWAAEVAAGHDAGVRISLRVEVRGTEAAGSTETSAATETTQATQATAVADTADPMDAGLTFTAVLQLHSLTYPTLVADAAAVWAGASPAGKAFGSQARMDTLLALRRAADVWAPLTPLLSAAVPGALELAEEEVAELLGPAGRALAAAGVQVHWPKDLTRTLTSRAEVGSPEAGDGSRWDGPEPGLPSLLSADALLSFSWRFAVGGQEVDRNELDRLAEAGRPLVRLHGQWVLIDPETVRAARDRPDRKITPLDALGAALTGSAEMPDGGRVEVTASGWPARLRDLLADPENGTAAAVRQPAALTATLRDYQVRGLGWLHRMTSLGLGACLADDMGLGKTITLISLHLHRQTHPASAGPTLVVCPASLMGNWQREIEKFAPGTPVRRFHGGRRSLAEPADDEFVLTTYGTMRLDAGKLAQVGWGLVVADEAQHVKNPSSATAKALRTLPAKARVALTGTPVENNLSELWAILDWTTPGLLGPLSRFRTRYAQVIEGGAAASPEAGAAAERLARLVRPFLLRRRKSDPGIAPELPPKTETDRVVALTREQAGLYEAVVREGLEEIAGTDGFARHGLVVKLLTSLKQICNHPAQYLKEGSGTADRGQTAGAVRIAGRSGKVELLDELLDTVLAEGSSVLVFTQYVQMARLLESHLATRGVPTQFLHGQTPVARREEMVRRFQDGAAPVFLLSLKAAGTGLNLTRASHVVHFDRWWNPAVEAQATDRAYRIGQTRPVQVHRIVTEGTIEDRIADMLARKQQLADAVLGSGEAALTELTDAELADLVALRGSER
ncbi:Superfamily II DNA or RNA helicase, SNF2 family [Streptomyces sp. 2224.1]|uniref:DEAD/DEAH box helicase n=1 Tax=Streptomyces sp. 2224.1 TaxID=1881020 RepID=UPI000897F683|nr:DEAD/DEAH box helicase [Streptomyces sp. 2224.1]SED92710.1 Superfamily II DNA or RNA helicase, SNF2 family [Streptomyces sp. 2224.1]